MLLLLGNPALLLLTGILRGVTAQDPRYQVYQLPSVSAQAGNSVMLPCNFTYPQDIKPVGDLRVYWRRGGFFGKFIYNHTEGFIHQDYQGRIVLVGDPQGSHTALIRINQLRSSDANVYVCHVRVQKKDGQWEQWRNIIGTNLTVPGPASLSIMYVILIGLGLMVSKASFCILVFAVGQRLGWDPGPVSVTRRVSGSDSETLFPGQA